MFCPLLLPAVLAIAIAIVAYTTRALALQQILAPVVDDPVVHSPGGIIVQFGVAAVVRGVGVAVAR